MKNRLIILTLLSLSFSFIGNGQLLEKLKERAEVDPVCETGVSWVLVGFYVLV
jgi:hypothetical protein